MNTNFERLTQLILGELTSDLLAFELELEQIVNDNTLKIRDKSNSIKRLLKKIVIVEMEIQKFTTMITKN